MKNKRIIYIALATAIILLIPLVLTLLGSGVDGEGWHWTFFDFVFMGILLFGTGLMYELVSRKRNKVYKAAVGVAAAAVLLLAWINAAVGIIGEDNATNLMYFGVIIVGIIGAIIARLEPLGMARALLATAIAQVLVPIIALIFWKPGVISWAPGVFVLNAFFVMLFVVSALLFRRAAR